MKAIQLRVNVSSIRSRKDGSLGLSLETPELDVPQKVVIMSLQNIECEMTLTPINGTDEIVEVKTDLDNKSSSQRLRDVLFVLYKQDNSTEMFDTYYQKKMEKIIEWVKSKLN
jgi:hypothetical protein